MVEKDVLLLLLNKLWVFDHTNNQPISCDSSTAAAVS